LGLLLLGSQAALPGWVTACPAHEGLRERVEQIRLLGALAVGASPVVSVETLPSFYEGRGFRPAWTDPRNTEQLLQGIRSADGDGLEPAAYHLAPIERLLAEVRARPPEDGCPSADLDLLQTDALLRLARDLNLGKVAPERLDPTSNLGRNGDPAAQVEALGRALEAGDIPGLLERSRPRHPSYGRLKAALAEYRRIAAAGGWPRVPDGVKLERGVRSEHVVALRKRLHATGDGPPAPAAGASLFDAALVTPVKEFQRRHGLTPDGIVGATTFEALNVPVEARIDQIRVNLERARWVLHEAQGDLLVVDIAGFDATYTRNGETVWRSRVQVGTPYRKTPTFKSQLTYLVFNPTWTVPPTILAKDILPAAKRDPGEIEKRGLRVLDREGRPVDPGSVQWSRYKATNFPYLLRQEPGPKNALGRIKFMFPNRHHVYLHDTPNKRLFDKPERAFSSGCIRIEYPLELAELLLDDQTRWNRERLTAAIDSRVTRTVFLPRPVPILLLYWTVFFDEAGRVGFKRDIYDRDAAVLEALKGDFGIQPRPMV
jgi:murein L,D-transpeptidase YcbB/YkuD